MLIDERFKDSSPEKTVEKIRGILASYGIETKEVWYDSNVKNCYSVRVSVKDAEFGANGKGITKELALASGYAELMERMQAGFLIRRYFREDCLEYADAKDISVNEFLLSCGEWLSDISRGLLEQFGGQISTAELLQKCMEAGTESSGTVQVLPFYNVTDDCMTVFPQRIIPSVYNTNGLAAGNSFEEAFVQGFSEIIERHLMVRCFFNDITPPDVPEDYLVQFKKSYEIIQDLRSHGLDIYIKDCSLDCPFPLLAAVAVDRKTHAYHVHMGAHPVFEIALERCLTEMFQGRNLDNVINTSELFIGNAKTRQISELLNLLTKGCGRYSDSFFSGTPLYEFRPAADRSGKTNRELLREIVDYVSAKGYKMLVRSVSHLGFTSVRIIIPGMSEALPNNLTDRFPQQKLLARHRDSLTMLSKLNDSQKEEVNLLLDHQVQNYGREATDFAVMSGRNITGKNRMLTEFIGRMVFSFFEWPKNPAKAIKYAKAVISIAPDWAESKLSCLFLVFDYQLNGCSLDQALSKIRLFFEDEVLSYVTSVFNEGRNPFEEFIPDCTIRSCADCRFMETCNIRNTDELIRKVQEATLQYNNEAAFARLKELFCSI